VLDPSLSQDEPMVRLERVNCLFGSAPPVVALRDVNLEVRRGEWLAVVGPSGSGKSTLLNIIGCLTRPTSGSYHFDGHDVALLSDRQRAGLRCYYIGFVFQAFHLLAHRSVIENVMLAETYGRRPRAGRVDRALAELETVGLADRTEFLPTQLSGGERQRVAIARALVTRPQLMLCDEPTGNLDSVTARSLLSVLGQLHDRGLTIIMITHDRDVAATAQRQVRITDGRVGAHA
jgi:putative ABC transport system ATP-binding protein